MCGLMTLYITAQQDGKAFRTLNIVDEYTLGCLMIKVQRKLNSKDVIDAL